MRFFRVLVLCGLLPCALAACRNGDPVTERAVRAWEKSYEASGAKVRVVAFRKTGTRRWRVNGTDAAVLCLAGVVEYQKDVPGAFGNLLHRKGDRLPAGAAVPFLPSAHGWVVDEKDILLAPQHD